MLHPQMPESMDNIALQAHEGSVAAIIQILNQQLAQRGVRTRAIFEDGVLQLLCEAAQEDQLEETSLIKEIRQSLEALAPRNIRRVKINSRIVREQQLLWLEEINRDPDNQVLWSREIILARPNIFKKLLGKSPYQQQFANIKKADKKADLTKTKVSSRRWQQEQTPLWMGILGGVGSTIIVLALAWLVWDWWRLSNQQNQQAPAPTSNPVMVQANNDFAQAVFLAEEAANNGQNAQTAAQWLDLAAKWQRASDLMAKIPPEDARYETAQARVKQYRENSEIALQQAQSRRSPSPVSP
ncbi:MAG: hypothetical protein HC916_05250 [Coleofasciculaceae cyanobacterium SM2_1_6]|nr:hypothetical protein [Coleofasciculaceae cyanobacterium SM2_1_6]